MELKREIIFVSAKWLESGAEGGIGDTGGVSSRAGDSGLFGFKSAMFSLMHSVLSERALIWLAELLVVTDVSEDIVSDVKADWLFLK